MKRKSLLNFLSKTGYKRNSPHVRRPMNLIPSGKITMKGVDFPVKGIDNLGNEQMMYPGLDYNFPGDYVLELPMMQPGGSTSNIKRVGKRKDEKNYIDSVLNANKNLDWVQRLYEKNPQSIQIPGVRGRATHYMESADNRVYPTVVRLPNSNLEYLGNDAYNYADSTKSFIQFPSDEEAQWFAKNYKKGTAVLPKKQKAGEWMGNKLDKQGLITYETKGGNYIAGLGNSIDGDQYINRMIDSGKFGYNPNNGALVRLGKPSSGMSKESAFYASPIYKELTSPVGKRKGEEGFLNRNQEQLFDSLPKWQQDIVEEHNAPLRNAWVKKSNKEMYESPLTYVPGMIGFSMLPLGFSSAYGLASSLSSAAQGNYKTAALEAGLSALPFASRAYRLNPNALKQPNLILTRTQKPGQTADLARLDELLQKQKLTKAEEIELVKLSQPGYGRGFDSNPNSINYYANPNIQQKRGYSGMPEIRVTSLPAEEAAKFNVGKNPVKDYISFKKDKEFLLPRNYVEASKSFMPKTYEELDQLRRAIDAEQTALSTPHWWRGYPSTPKQLPGSGNVNQPVGNIFSKFFKKEIPDWAIKEMRFSSLPELNNKQATEVLENFRARIKTTEGQKRLKELGITDTGILNDLKILADDETLGHYWFQKIGLNPNLPEMKRVTRHEIEHAVQEARNISLMNKYNQDAGNLKYLFRPKKGRLALEEAVRNTTDIDELLKGLELRKTPEKVDWNAIKSSDKKDPAQLFEYMSNKQRATNYFDSGSGGKEKSAFLGEVQQYMMDNNIIPKTSYVEVTPEMVKNTFVDAMFDETGGGKYLRLFNIMKPTEANYKLISEGLNKMLGLVPPAAIIGAGAMQEQKYGGALPKAQLGKYIPSWLNPYNWGVEDYSEYKTRGQAFNAARNAGEEEFMYKGKRYNTRKDTDDLNITMPDKNLNPGWTGKKYNDWLKTNYPEFFKVINRGKGVNEIEFGYDWRNTGFPTRASYSDWLNKIYVGSKEINLDNRTPVDEFINRTPVDEFIGRDEVLGSIIAEMAHAKDSKVSNNPFKSYAWKPGIDNFRYGENKYNVPGTVEYNTHRLYEPGLAMIAYGDLSPNDIKRIQKYLGVKEDGYLGEKTYKAIQDKYNNSPYIKNALEYHQIYTRDADKNAISMGDYARLAKAYLHQINQDVPLRDSTRFFDVDYNSDYTDDALLNIKSGSGNYDVKELQRALHKRGYKLPNSINEHDNFDGIYGDETKTALLDYQSKLPKKQLAGENYIPASESTGVNTYIRRYDLPVITKEMQDERELARRKQAIQASQKAGSKPFFSRERWTPENFALETGATGDKLRFFSDDPDSFIDEYLNPLKMIGDMASGLGRMPLNISQGNYGQAAMSVATPLVVGATAGLGAKTAGQFVNNLANPLAGTGQFLTTKTPLKNAYKYNPWAFKPKEGMMYRGIGKEGMEDAIQSGVFRQKAKRPPGIPDESGVRLKGKGFGETYFSPEFSVADRYGKGFIAEVPKKSGEFKMSDSPNHASGWSQYVESPIPISEGRILQKDWLRGYKPVNTPVNTPAQLPGFRSEIDWGKWNPETPNYPELINEYNAIEESTKKAGTWMKNPDGSAFQGTPEQFIQQRSSWFKKAFGDSKLVHPDGSPWILEHGSPKKFDTFDESKFQLGDSGYSGSGIYTVPPKGSADSYTISGRRFHKGDIEPTLYKLYGLGKNPITSEELIKMGVNSPAGKEMDLFNFHRKSAPLNEQLLDYDVAIDNQNRGVARVRDLDDAWEVVFPTNKQLKSATGNVGFFDMTNPNIYKAAAPISIGLGTTTTQEYQNGGYTTSPASTYFGGTLPEVFVSSDQVPYPYYNQLTPEEKRFFNDEGSIGRGVRSIAKTGKRGQTYNDLSRVAKDAEIFAAEMTGIPGSIRFAQDPVKKLKGAGRTLEATILGSSPFITSPYNKEDVADFFDTMDAAGVATAAVAPFKTPLQQGIKSSAKYLTQGPLRNAWKLNPKAYQYNLPENTMWRGLGKEGMEDAISSRLFRAKQDVIPVYHGATKLRLNKSFGTNPYFTPKFKTAATYGADYLAEVPGGAANWRQRYIRSDWSQVADRPIPINEGRILKKDWWMGYKPVEVPKQLGGMTTLPKAQNGEYLYPQNPLYPKNPYGFTPGHLNTDGTPIYSGVNDPVYFEKLQNNTEYTQEDFRNAVINARDNFDKQTDIIYNFDDDPDGAIKPFWEVDRISKQIKEYDQYSQKVYRILRTQHDTGEMSPEDASNLKLYEGIKKQILNDFGVKDLSELHAKKRKIEESLKNPIMDLDNYHTNQSTIINGKEYLSAPLALELAYRNSGKRDEKQAGAYYLDRDFPISKELGMFDYNRFITDPQYRIDVTKEYRKLPGVKESLDAYRAAPLKYEPSASFYGYFKTENDNKGSYSSGNAIHLDYGQLSRHQDGLYSLKEMSNTLDHELSHRENNYLEPIVKELANEYESKTYGSFPSEDAFDANKKKMEDKFYNRLNMIYPQQRVIEGLSNNSVYVTTPISRSPRLKPYGDNDLISDNKDRPWNMLGTNVEEEVEGPYPRKHEEATEETLADIKAIQKILHDNKEYGYNYADRNSYVTQEMLEKLIKDIGDKTLYTKRVFGRYKNQDGTYNLDKILKALNLTSNEPSTPLYLSGLSDVSHSKNGGELFNGYKRYIMGDYKPEEEKDLKNTYDKLNRNYYKKAKESGMTAPNYIMSML